jgi:phosphatidylserine/phosphatidylglycerophosphate/cardiolipin synthase-like enzyme
LKRLFVLVPAAVAALVLTTLSAFPSQATTGSRSTTGSHARAHDAGQKGGKPHKPHKPKWVPPEGAWFNTPRHGAKQWVLHEHIVQAINHAKPGSFIRIALFSFDRKYVAGKLIAAHRRGVHVQVLLNDHQVTPAQKMLHRALGTNRWHKSFTYECHHGCRSSGENLHTKFYLFDHTGGAHDTVMTGSVNLTGNSAMNQYNDLWVINNAKKLTSKFKVLWRQMRKDRPAHPGWLVQHVGHRFRLEATPYPHPGPHHDPIISILNKVHCLGATKGTGNKVHHTVVRVIMHAWNDERGTYLAQKVRQMYAAGCDVKLQYGFGGASVRDTFASRTKRGYLPVHTTGMDTNDDGLIDLYTHQKELLISGHYGKSTHARIVVTGSSNWNTDGVRGDEEIFLIKNRIRTWNEYIADFQRMWEKFSTRVKYIPYPNPDPNATTAEGLRRMGMGSAAFEPHSQVVRFTIAPTAKRGGPAWEGD